jgi:hypothetical protein
MLCLTVERDEAGVGIIIVGNEVTERVYLNLNVKPNPKKIFKLVCMHNIFFYLRPTQKSYAQGGND